MWVVYDSKGREIEGPFQEKEDAKEFVENSAYKMDYVNIEAFKMPA